MSFFYVPKVNEDIFFDTKDIVLADYRLIKLLEIIYPLDRIYKIEKIISFNDVDFLNEISSILKRPIELYNHKIYGNTGFFHITFEKELDKNLSLNYDTFCPYAISIVIQDNLYEEIKLNEEFNNKKKYFLQN